MCSLTPFRPGGYVQALQWEKLCTALASGVTGSAISFAQGGSLESGFLAGFGAGAVAGYMPNANIVEKAFAAAIVGGCASVVGGGKFETGAVTGAFTSLAWSALGTPEARQKIWGDIKNAAGATWGFFMDHVLLGSRPDLLSLNPLGFEDGNYGGGNITNGLHMSQKGLSPSAIGPGPGNQNPDPAHDLDGGGFFGGYLGHDRGLATKLAGYFPPVKAVYDVMLITDCAVAPFGVGPYRAAAVFPSLEAAVGITIAIPFHATGLSALIPGNGN